MTTTTDILPDLKYCGRILHQNIKLMNSLKVSETVTPAKAGVQNLL